MMLCTCEITLILPCASPCSKREPTPSRSNILEDWELEVEHDFHGCHPTISLDRCAGAKRGDRTVKVTLAHNPLSSPGRPKAAVKG